ncbi:MAG: hypothetical protein DRP42_01350 [Tenericutes bacterium]|nr:MAG: hypothetical protein DRP42_01350 [Mycoplasmatota bacterium]
MPAATQPIFAITLGFITFIGIYVVGIATRGLLRFGKEKYKNPIEIFTQISPLLSISMRLFGATVATAVLFNLMTIILEGVGRTDFAAIWPAFNFFIK